MFLSKTASLHIAFTKIYYICILLIDMWAGTSLPKGEQLTFTKLLLNNNTLIGTNADKPTNIQTPRWRIKSI